MLIDSHCHILSNEYEDVDKVIKNSLKIVDKIIINSYDLESSKEAVKLAKKYDNVYVAIGISPDNVDTVKENDINCIKLLSKEAKVVAIGEIGLDYYWTKENKNIQIEIFEEMIKIAKMSNLPVIVHNRSATDDVYRILKDSDVTGIIHCFSGSLEIAREFIKLGFLIGIGGVVTFKNSKNIKEVVKNIPLSSISLETDSPYLTPEPYRGTINDPTKIVFVAKKISELKGIDVDTVINQTGLAVCSKFDLS